VRATKSKNDYKMRNNRKRGQKVYENTAREPTTQKGGCRGKKMEKSGTEAEEVVRKQ